MTKEVELSEKFEYGFTITDWVIKKLNVCYMGAYTYFCSILIGRTDLDLNILNYRYQFRSSDEFIDRNTCICSYLYYR